MAGPAPLAAVEEGEEGAKADVSRPQTWRQYYCQGPRLLEVSKFVGGPFRGHSRLHGLLGEHLSKIPESLWFFQESLVIFILPWFLPQGHTFWGYLWQKSFISSGPSLGGSSSGPAAPAPLPHLRPSRSRRCSPAHASGRGRRPWFSLIILS